ncbi:hypothetical protein [uncultured Gammaproteobacteria bacterium]|nr:hypothetical protein [uncultured Gammaproteobacteria bacterium]
MTCNAQVIGDLSCYNGNNSNNEKCDYIELRALTSADRIFIDNELSDMLFGPPEDNIRDEDKAELYDGNESQLLNLFSILEHRRDRVQENYPFDVENGGIFLKERLSNKQKIYLVLLCCANLKIFRECQPLLTNEFESLTYYAIKGFLPNFEIKKLGYQADYTGNTGDKLKDLSKDMHVPLYDNEINKISNNASKEKGVDLVAWYNFENKLPNTIIILIQCTCGRDTTRKQHETKKYGTFFDFGKYGTNVIHSLSTPKSSETHVLGDCETMSDFTNGGEGRTLFFDRNKLIQLIGTPNDKLFDGDISQSIDLVNGLIERKLSVSD